MFLPQTAKRHLLMTILLILTFVSFTIPAVPPANPAKTVSAKVLFERLSSKLAGMPKSNSVMKDFNAFSMRHSLKQDESQYNEYARVKILYEATRDAGTWGIHWKITNEEPSSKKIWLQWQHLKGNIQYTRPTAIAECDEISALFAYIAKKIGIRGIGLFWPTSNHTVAIWFMKPKPNTEVRVIVPTTQIFLQDSDYFDTNKFDPWHQKSVWEYNGKDILDNAEMPEELADFMISQLVRYGGASEKTYQYIRYLRDCVFRDYLTPSAAASRAQQDQASVAKGSPEDTMAIASFIEDMKITESRKSSGK
jgi:hypothetical protein